MHSETLAKPGTRIKPSPFQMIVGLHDVAEVPDARDDELLSWVAFSRLKPLLAEIIENTRRTGNELHVTSDDGFRSDYEILLPWLLENRIGGTFFIATRFIDREGRLSVQQLREIAGLGIRIGVHGAAHLPWSRIPRADFLRDVEEGRDRLQQMIGAPVDAAAPPFGAFDGFVIKHLFAMGFREVHTSRQGLACRAVPLKPRNMLKESQLDAVLATSRRPASLTDAARCYLRRWRASLPNLRAPA